MWLRCLVIVACVAVASIAQTTTTNATATLTATPAPTNATTTPVPTNASNATNATTTTLVPKTYVRRRNTTVTLTRYIPSNSTTAAPNATSKPNTTAVPKRRTKTRTLPVVTSPTTPAPPPPTANGDDLNNPKMTAYVAMILTTPVATFNADSFRSTLLAAITNATLPPLLLILDYCGANATESSSVWQANNACADRVDSRYVNTLVHFGFNNADTSYYSTTNIDRTKLPLATSGSTVLFAVLAYSSLAYSPVVTPSPGVISSVTSSASSATTVFVVILIIVLVVCVACLTLQYCRKKRLTEETRRKEEAVAAAVARRRGQDATAGRGDIYEMQDRDDAEPQQHDDEHDEDDPAAKPAPVPAPKPSAAANPNGTSLFNSRPAWGQSNAGVAAGQPAQAAPPPTAQSTYGTPAAAPQYAQQPAPTYAAQPQASPTAVPAAGMYSASNTPTTATAAPTYQYGAAATVPTAQPAVYQYGTNAAAPPTAAQPAYQYGAATTAPPAAQPTYQYGAAPAAQPTYQYGTAPQAAPYTSGTYSDPTSPADVPPERQTTQQPLYGQHATNGAAGQVSYE